LNIIFGFLPGAYLDSEPTFVSGGLDSRFSGEYLKN